MTFWIYAGGFFSLCFGVFHLFFWRLLNWKEQLPKLSSLNRGVVQILNLRLIYVFLFVAILCFMFPVELLETEMGHFILLGCSFFWLGRFLEQFLFFNHKDRILQLLTVVFGVGALLFLIPLLVQG